LHYCDLFYLKMFTMLLNNVKAFIFNKSKIHKYVALGFADITYAQSHTV